MSDLVLESTAAPTMYFSLVDTDSPVSPAARYQVQLCYNSHGFCIQFCPLCLSGRNTRSE